MTQKTGKIMQVPEGFKPRIPEWAQLKASQENDIKLES
jgi:hypothetical protein